MAEQYQHYYVPAQSPWPIVGSIGIGAMAMGLGHMIQGKPLSWENLLQGKNFGYLLFLLGCATLIYMLYGWFRDVIHESHQELYSAQMDRSFRWGMGWFIFSELMLFMAFFGVFFYARFLSVPWLGGEGHKVATHLFLWPSFVPQWPLLKLPDPSMFTQAKATISAWGLPAINTLILLSSGMTITWAHWGLMKKNRAQLIGVLLLTIALGITFLILQGIEYHEAYYELNLKLTSGIYGTTFFMLTGFHGLHVTLGTIMLIVILFRSCKGHFTPEKHFAFEASAWYWHFVDIVWLLLFVLVYWL
jgi:cytochrome c oxidase subunit 3